MHRLKDLTEPQQIYALCHPDLRSEFPALRSLSAQPNNLPAQMTPFIGRQSELQELDHLLRESNCRLITLIGPGGMGKTRLSLQAAAEHVGAFPHGVYFVPLAPIQSPEYLPSAVADALKFSFQQAGDQKEQLIHYLGHKEMLLVMDNFEHVIDGADLVADLLQRTRIQVIATSRERLNLQSECLYELGGLGVPPSTEAAVFEDFEAVEMFVAYARRAQPDYQLDPADKPAIAQICSLLNGMPLGIALAASWVRTLPPSEIAAELRADLDFLATTMRDVPERHRSMRAVFEYSWNLLSEKEQTVFTMLSIFRGGFTRDAATKVTGANLPILSALVDKSLIHRDPDGRYQVHELLRQYAEEKLRRQPGEAEALQEKHSEYYIDLLARLGEGLISRTPQGPSREIEADLDNIRTAWRWAVEHANTEMLRKANFALEFFMQFKSRYLEGYELFELAVDSLSRQEPTGIAGEALAVSLVMMYWFGIRLGQFDRARQTAEQSWELYQALALGPREQFGTHPLAPLSILRTISGNFKEAIELGELLYELGKASNLPPQMANAAYALIGPYAAIGNLERAQWYGEQALALSRQIDLRWFDAYILNELGHLARVTGNLEKAKACYRESYEIREEAGDPEGVAVARNHLAEIELLQGNYAEARSLFERSLAIYEDIMDQGGLATTLNGLGCAEMALDDRAAACGHLRQALEIASGIQFVPLMLTILSSLGDLYLRIGEQAKGISVLSLVLAHPASNRESLDRAQALLKLHQLEPIMHSEAALDLQTAVSTALGDLAARAASPAKSLV